MTKFYRTVYEVEILSEDKPATGLTLEEMAYAITDDCSGAYEVTVTEEKTGPEMAQLLIAQGSEPEFFNLDALGNELNEEGS